MNDNECRHTNYIHSLFNEYMFGLKRILFWDGASTTYGRAIVWCLVQPKLKGNHMCLPKTEPTFGYITEDIIDSSPCFGGCNKEICRNTFCITVGRNNN
jgi:hypothetical protein